MIYIHVPFCKSFCTYCDFYSEIAQEGMFARYTDQVCAEIRRRKAEMDSQPNTLYFGGGTPSVLPLGDLTRILLTLEECGHGGPYTEFTLEVNPDDIVEKGRPYLDSLRMLGVNRMSIGVQSFDDDLLKWMNRRHDAARAKQAFAQCPGTPAGERRVRGSPRRSVPPAVRHPLRKVALCRLQPL